MKLKRILAGVLTAAMVITSVPVAGLGGMTAEAAATVTDNKIMYTDIDLNDGSSYNQSSDASFFQSSSAYTNISFNMVVKYNSTPVDGKYALFTLADDDNKYITVWHNPVGQSIVVDCMAGNTAKFRTTSYRINGYGVSDTLYHELGVAFSGSRIYMQNNEGANVSDLNVAPIFNTNGWQPTKVYIGKNAQEAGITPDTYRSDVSNFPGEIAYLEVSKNVENPALSNNKGVAGINDLQNVSVDALEAAISSANNLSEDDYEEAGWTAFAAAKLSAQTALNADDATDASLWNALDVLETAQESLKKKTPVEDTRTALAAPSISLGDVNEDAVSLDGEESTSPATVTAAKDTIEVSDGFTANDDGSFKGTFTIKDTDTENDSLDVAGNTPFIMSFKLKYDEIPSGEVKLVQKESEDTDGSDWQYAFSLTATTIAVFNNVESNPAGQKWPQSDLTYSRLDNNGVGEWHDIAVVYTGSQIQLYVDGMAGTNRSVANFAIPAAASESKITFTEANAVTLSDFALYKGVDLETSDYAAVQSSIESADSVLSIQKVTETTYPYTLSTTWTEGEDGGNTATVTLVPTDDTTKFTEASKPESILVDGEEVTDFEVTVASDGNSMTIVYTVAPEEVIVPAEKLVITKATVPSSTTNETHGDGGGAEAIYDGNTATRWHTSYAGDEERDGAAPVIGSSDSSDSTLKNLTANNEIVLELQNISDVTKLRYLPKQSDSSTNGRITKCDIYTAGSDGTYTESPVTSAVWSKAGIDWREVSFDSKNVKYVKVVVTQSCSDASIGFICAAEMEVYGTVASTEISKAELTVEAPAFQTTPATEVTVPADAKYTAAAPVWNPKAQKFAANQEYEVSVVVTPTGEYTFAEGVTATVNGKEATVTAGEAEGTVVVSYTFAAVEDPTEAKEALEAALDKAPSKNEDEDGNQKYTTSSWNSYVAAYNAAVALVNGELTGKTPEEFNDAKTALEEAKNNLRELGSVEEITSTPDVTVTAPVAGEKPEDAALTLQGNLDTKVKVTYTDMSIDEEGGISGKIIAPNEYEENAVFKETSKFLFRFEIKTDKTTNKQSIVGVMNEQWGLQIEGNLLCLFGHLSGGWYQVNYTIPNDDWYGNWHDVIAIYDGDLFQLYVDGTEGTTAPGYSGRHGNLVDYSTGSNPSVFTIGYNAGYENGVKIDGQDFTGKLRDLYMYRGDQVPEYTIGEDDTAEEIQQMFTEALQDKNSSFEMTGLPPEEQTGYTVKSTTWTPADEAFDRYTDYEVKVVVAADDGKVFTDDATAVLRTSAGVLEDATVSLNSDNTEMTITYTFAGEEHPRTTLQNYLNSEAVKAIGTKNEENGTRKYTVASWNAYVEAFNTANTTVGNENLQPEEYTTAKTNLETAISGLKLAAENCECVLGDLTGFEGNSYELAAGGKQEVTLPRPGYTYSQAGSCIKHPDAAAQVTYALVGSPKGATLEGNKLTLTSEATTVQVRVTVTLGDQSKTATATYTVTKKGASEEQKAALDGAVQNVKDNYLADADKYTAESWAEVQEALKAAEALGSDATEEEVTKATKAIQDALKKLVIKDKKALEDLMNEIAALNSSDYTAATWNAMVAVYNKATEIDPATATLADYSEAYKALVEAKAALVTKAEELAAAKADMDKALASAKAIIDAGQGTYTDATWAPFKSAYDAAVAGAANNAITAAQLKELLTKLTSAQAALAKAAGTPVGTIVNGQSAELASGRYQVINAAKKTAKLVQAKNKNKASITIPAQVTINGVKCKVVQVGPNAFKGFKKLKKITLTKNITTIGKQAFYGCTKLSSVVVKGTGLKAIKSGAFKKTSKKMTVTFKSKKVKASKRKALLKKMKKAGMSASAKVK